MTTDTDQLAKLAEQLLELEHPLNGLMYHHKKGKELVAIVSEPIIHQLAQGFLDMKKERDAVEKQGNDITESLKSDKHVIYGQLLEARRHSDTQQAQLKAAEEALAEVLAEFKHQVRLPEGVSFPNIDKAETTLATIRTKEPQPEKQP